MRASRVFRRLINIVLFGGFPLIVMGQPTARDFQIVDLGTFGDGTGSYARAINNRGQVVGFSYGDVTHAWLWEHGVVSDLDVGGNTSRAWGLNDGGEIVGELFSAITDLGVAFIWKNRDATYLESPSSARAINNRGDVVGFIPTPGVASCCGFYFDKSSGSMRNLGAYWPSDINGQGQIVGSRRTLGGASYPFIWDPSAGFTDIDTDGSPGSASAINDLGQVVGSVSVSDNPNDTQRAFLWDNGTTIYLEVGGGDEVAHDINNKGQVVGESSFRAVLWERGRLIPLPEESGPSFAYSINDNGEIAGATGRPNDAVLHAVLWTRKP